MDKHCQQHDHSNGFMNGFLMGAIIGAAVVFFLFTEKGKKLLETIMEEGSEGFADLRDLIQEEMGEEDDDETVRPSIPVTTHGTSHSATPEAVSESAAPAPRVKRFFKRSK